MSARLSELDILQALERAIKPLDDSASMLALNDRLLDLIVDELVGEDDPVRRLGVEPWLVLLDLCSPDAYELACLIDDCDQAGHSWHGLADQLTNRVHNKLSAEELVTA